ncbi:MAG TPA: hypothetical protein VFN35_15755 [Ktedonobacteraceae bacterium]|nr:hypothetical protein [Ktedonobacteraceae bacterium]
MYVKPILSKKRFLLGLLVLTLLALTAYQGPSALANPASLANMAAPQASISASTKTTQQSQWNAFIYGFNPAVNEGILIHQAASSSAQEVLTQHVILDPRYYSVSPDGKNAVYSQVMNGMRQYLTVTGPHPASGFFYQTSATVDAGNLLWNSDSRTVMVLDRNRGVSVVDTQTGLTSLVFGLPYRSGSVSIQRITKLVFVRDGFIYFLGDNDSICAGILCRAMLVDNPQVTPLVDPGYGINSYLMSSDGKTIYYRNTSMFHTPGIYALNSDGTHTRLVRASTNSQPIGFGAHGELIVMNKVSSGFQVVQLGATSSQDTVLLVNAAPGALSLCDSDHFAGDVCTDDVLLSPDDHAIVVQGTLANGQDQLWITDLQTGKQRVMANPGNAQGHPVQLLGWDVLKICISGAC